jgi:hypothetical protein
MSALYLKRQSMLAKDFGDFEQLCKAESYSSISSGHYRQALPNHQ